MFGPDLYDRVLNAKDAHSLFGEWGEDAEAVEKAYRRFLWVHPDHAEPQDLDRATEAFVRLSVFKDQALALIMNDSYGQKTWSITTKKGRTFTLDEEPRWSGDSCDVFLGMDDKTQPMLAKVARNPADADLLANEARMIRRARKAPDEEEDSFRQKLIQPYLPAFMEAFQVPIGGTRHRGNAFAYNKDLVSLSQVYEGYKGEGIPPRHGAWIFRRLLTSLGAVHQAGVVHGAIVPDHVLIQPAQHGVVLIDWRAATEIGGKISVVASDWSNFYPDRVLDKKPARPEYDINMAAMCMLYMTPRHAMPIPLRAFYKGCTSSRLPDAWDLKDEYDALIERLWGPRTFMTFPWPPSN